MYTSDRYKNTNRAEMLEFIRSNMFGILVMNSPSGPVATHIPMLLEETHEPISLVGHLSKENEQAGLFHEQLSALAIFHGPHAYVSSSWYNHDNVSTWNYIAVHASGKISPLTELELYEQLMKLTNSLEQSSEKPKYFENIGTKVIRDLIPGVAGFRLQIESLQSNFKLSQNRDAEDHARIIRELENRNDENSKLIAEEMRKRKR